MDVVLLRHGKTPGNMLRRYEGRRTNTALSEEGAAELRELTEFSSADVVYVSPLLRAQQTASHCFPRAEQRVVDGLAEMDFGAFEGRAYKDDLEFDAAYQAWLETECCGAIPQGESQADFCNRTCAAFVACIEEVRAQNENHLIVVAHGGTVMAVMSRFCCEPREYFEWHLRNATGYHVELLWQEDGSFVLVNPQLVVACNEETE